MVLYFCMQSEPDSGYHTGSGNIRSAGSSTYTPGERTLTREDLRRRISIFNSNNHGLEMKAVSSQCVADEQLLMIMSWILFDESFNYSFVLLFVCFHNDQDSCICAFSHNFFAQSTHAATKCATVVAVGHIYALHVA